MRYEALDSWRGICASMVMIYHFAIASHFYPVGFIRNSFLFVDFFFVLSGFVIAINYEDRLKQGFGVVRFMALRLGRVWPLHAFLLAAFIVLELILLAVPFLQAAIGRGAFSDDAHSIAAIFTNLTLVHSLPGVHEDVTWNGPSWSISVEFYTYLIFAVGLWIVSRLPKSNWFLIFGVLGIMIAAPIFIYNFGAKQNIFLTTGGGLVRCLYGFAAGVLASKILLAYKDQILALFRKPYVATLLEVVATLGTIVFVSLIGFSSFNLLAPYLFLIVILIFAPQAGAISKFLLMKPLLRLGALSYSIYLVHYIVQAVLYIGYDAVFASSGQMIFDRLGSYDVPYADMPKDRLWLGDFYVITTSVVVVWFSHLTYERVEKPGRDLVRNWVGSWKKHKEPAK